MNSDVKTKEQFAKIMSKAESSLDVAKRNFQEGYYDFASSRAYYAVFYAIQAVLLTKGLSFSKHSSTIGAFNKHFVKTGQFPKEFTKLINQLFLDRQMGDYDFDSTITAEDVTRDIEIGERILGAVKNFLIQKGFL